MKEPFDINEFVKYLFEQDEVSTILKCHLTVEQRVNDILKKVFPKPDKIIDWYLSSKIELLNALELLKNSLHQDLKRFNKLRNDFSHHYRYQLSPKDKTFLKKFDFAPVPEALKKTPKIKECSLIVSAAAYLSVQLVNIEVKEKKSLSKLASLYLSK